MWIKQFCESGLSCVVETNKHNKIGTMYYLKLISASSNLFEKRDLENCLQFNKIPFEKIHLQIYTEIQLSPFSLWHEK